MQYATLIETRVLQSKSISYLTDSISLWYFHNLFSAQNINNQGTDGAIMNQVRHFC